MRSFAKSEKSQKKVASMIESRSDLNKPGKKDVKEKAKKQPGGYPDK